MKENKVDATLYLFATQPSPYLRPAQLECSVPSNYVMQSHVFIFFQTLGM